MLPAATVLVMLPPVWVPTRNGDCGEVPDRSTCWNGKPELFPTTIVVAVVPVVAGLKATLNVQEAPGLTVGPQVVVSGKIGSKSNVIPKKIPLRAAFPVFVIVIVCEADSVPTNCGPKVSDEADKLIIGAVIPAPLRFNCTGIGEFESTVKIDDSAPATLGVNCTPRVQL